MNKKDKENFELLKYAIERNQSGGVLSDHGVKAIEHNLKGFDKVPNEVANYIKGAIQEEGLVYWLRDGGWGAILAFSICLVA